MKRAILITLLLFAVSTVTVAAPNDYPVAIHVHSSYFLYNNGGVSQMLDTVIDGKKFMLADFATGQLLAIGDYKAKFIKDEHKTPYESHQVYEFLFPDGKTRNFNVVGQTE
jgi:hypothetical protein